MIKKRLPAVAAYSCLCLPFVALLLKNVMLQGYITGNNSYILDFWQGFAAILPYFPLQLAVTALFAVPCLLFKKQGRYYYGLILNLVLTVMLMIDVVYYRCYNVLPSAVMLPVAFSQGGAQSITETITALFVWSDLWFVADFVLWGVLYGVCRRHGWLFPWQPKRRFVFSGVIAGVCALVLTAVPALNLFGMDGGVYRGMYITSDTIRRSQSLSSAGFHTADIVQTLFGQVTEGSFSAQDEQLYDAYFSWKNSDTKESIYTGGFKGYNLLVIQVESLESFMLDQTLDGQEITPTLNRLMKEGYYFPNIRDQAKCGNSSDSDFMLMTGLLPTNRGYAFGSYADNDYHSLQTILKENGDYTSYYFHGAANATWNYEEMLADALKVDNLVMDYDQSEQLNGYLSDESFFEQTLELLSQQPLTEPFYAHVVTCSSHIPCNVPEGFEELHMDKELEEHPMGQYLQAIHYTDRQIGVFLDELENRGILENTLIAVVGDHGGVHKYYPHYVAAMDEEISEEWFLRDNDYTLPLILYNENIEDPKIFSVTGGQIDVLPSLLSLLGVDTDTMEKVMLGRDLFSTSRDFAFRDEEVLYGSLSDSDRAVAKTMFYLSDLMMRSNRLTD